MTTKKTFATAGLLASMLVLLSGCVGQDANGNPTGLIWTLLGQPMSTLITFFAENQALGYGVAIILVTIIVRVIILPLGLYQAHKAAYQAEKMAYMQPILAPIQERMRNAQTQEEKLLANQEFMAAQRENGLNPFGGIGCLPILIQMPFFSALFFAAQHTPGIAGSSWLNIPLDSPSMLLTILTGVLYLIQSALTLVGVTEEQRKQMQSMVLISPLMIMVFSFSSPAGVALYWLVGGFFSIIQQLITMYMVRPRLRKQVAKEFEENPPKTPSPFGTAFGAGAATNPIKDVTPPNSQNRQQANNKRNAGKQRSR